ncbi:MAG TPA: CdaR family protein [Syntrophorhabdaceae bacterium]|nr:CdaR family protein [Syntrophorhabdaceae bacterium]HQM80677.1 CdaR family protein [Syntrophorhabdaceae bacterium]
MGLLRKYVLNDMKLKLLSLVLAVLLWFAVSYIGESKMNFSVPVSVSRPGDAYIVTSLDSEDVLVTINGPVSTLKNMKTRDINVPLNLSNLKEGRHTFNLLKENIQVPKGVQVERIEPDSLTVAIDSVTEKRLKIVVKLDKKWVGQYTVQSWSPSYIVAEGAKSSLADKTTIETQVVDGNFQGDEEEIWIALNPKDMIVKRLRPNTVKVILRRLL